MDLAEKIISADTTVFWFRRDLRLEDNAGLYHALKSGHPVVCVFIFDTCILDDLDDRSDRRVDFIHQSLLILKTELEAHGSTLLILHGDPVKLFKRIAPHAVYTNHDFESYGKSRDAQVKRILEKKNGQFFSFKDHVLFEKAEVVKDNGEPYTVFTPYARKWKSMINKFYLQSYPVERYVTTLLQMSPAPFPSLSDIGFKKTDLHAPPRLIKTSIIKNYHGTRDYPGMHGTSRLGVHLRFGTVSIRKVTRLAKKTNDTWLNELIWRDFYHSILWHFPHVEHKSFKPAYDQIPWRNNAAEFEAWCQAKTGYPIVDAGIRELNTTGFMHNRVRMIVASFLTKHLLIDWRWGEAYFAKKLLDYDLAANNGGWQWASGSGCDAAPYFRVFNPQLQTDKFDPKHQYIKQWVPEVNTAAYPPPIVDHQFARERAIKTFQKAFAKR